jgi:hypothetical protein
MTGSGPRQFSARKMPARHKCPRCPRTFTGDSAGRAALEKHWHLRHRPVKIRPEPEQCKHPHRTMDGGCPDCGDPAF